MAGPVASSGGPSPWQGKTVLITGGAGGMGLAFAERYRAAGAFLALADLDAGRLATAAKAIGDGCLAIACDVARASDCARMVETTLARFGRLDLLINAAGIWVEGPAEEMTEAIWDRCLDINLKGTFFACRHAIPALERTQGSILNIASDAGLMGSKGASVYCASKGGVVLLTKALALELAPRGVRCNAVCPCDVDTPMIEYQASAFGKGDPEGYKRALLAIYPQGTRARFASAGEIAEFVFAVTSPSLAPLTGACLSIDFGTTAGR
jgi:NAD(P)-dependent dehydrogenase (short-subunit alcohol dehydrogenase family)